MIGIRCLAAAALVGCLAALLIVASCNGDDSDQGMDEATEVETPPTVALPAQPAPFDVAALDLPDDVSEVVALMSRLPDTIEGLVQADPVHGEGDVRVGYGADDTGSIAAPGITFQAVNLASPEVAYPPNWRAGQVVEEATLASDVVEFGLDGEIAWARRGLTGADSVSGTAPAGMQQELLFGETSGSWVFSVQAAGEDLLASAMAAFEMAAAGQP